MEELFSELQSSPEIPGELLIKLRREVLPSEWLGETLSVGAVGPLEEACRRIGAERLEPLYSPSVELEAVNENDSLLGWDSADAERSHSYLLRFDPQIPSNQAVTTLLKQDEVVAAVCANAYRYGFQEFGAGGATWDWPAAIGLSDAWNRGASGKGVRVAVLDTGASLGHPAFTTRLAKGIDFVDLGATPAPPGWAWEGDFKNPDTDPSDDVGHGTEMTGLTGGFKVGPALGCELLPVRVLARLGETSSDRFVGFGAISDVVRGIDWAVERGASILNLSFGFTSKTWAEEEAVKRAFRRNCLIVAAMGNGGPTGRRQFPAAFSEVLAVGAVDSQLKQAAFSQSGDHIDLVAPGVDIRTTVPGAEGFGIRSGTSHATAIVSGVAALVRSVKPNILVGDLVKILASTAVRNPWSPPFPRRDIGFGLVHAGSAVARAQALP